jgi:hypothetical protein
MDLSSLSNLLSNSGGGGKISVAVNRDVDGVKLFTSVKVRRAGIKFPSQVFRHHMDDGSSKVDGRVTLPIEIEIDVYSNKFDVIEKLNEALLDRSGTYTIVVKGLTFSNFLFDSEEISNTGKIVNSTPLTYRFKQLLLSQNLNQNVFAQPADNSTSAKGIVGNLVESAQATVGSVVSSVVASAGSAVSSITGGLL